MITNIRKKGFLVEDETYETILRKSVKLSNKPKFETVEKILMLMREDAIKMEIDSILQNVVKHPELWSSILIPMIEYFSKEKKKFHFF
jgi:hypothetical protein